MLGPPETHTPECVWRRSPGSKSMVPRNPDGRFLCSTGRFTRCRTGQKTSKTSHKMPRMPRTRCTSPPKHPVSTSSAGQPSTFTKWGEQIENQRKRSDPGHDPGRGGGIQRHAGRAACAGADGGGAAGGAGGGDAGACDGRHGINGTVFGLAGAAGAHHPGSGARKIPGGRPGKSKVIKKYLF